MEKTILIVDDQKPVRKLAKEYMKRLNYNVLEAEDGKQGLEMTISQNPDLIWTDGDMPNMTGYEMALQLRENTKTKSTPIIGWGNFDDVQRQILDAYMGKGSIGKLKEICSKIEELLK